MAEVNLDVAMESTSQKILSKINTTVTANVVKSVQHQYVSSKSASSNPRKTLTISPVNPEKSFVLVRGDGYNGTEFVVGSFDGTTIKLYTTEDNNNYSSYVAITVIEFY